MFHSFPKGWCVYLQRQIVLLYYWPRRRTQRVLDVLVGRRLSKARLKRLLRVYRDSEGLGHTLDTSQAVTGGIDTQKGLCYSAVGSCVFSC